MIKENTEFDLKKALKGIQAGKPFTGKNGALTSLIKNLAEAALEGELDSHLGKEYPLTAVTEKPNKKRVTADLP